MKHYRMAATECQEISKHCAKISVALKCCAEPESAKRAATAIIRTIRRAGPRSAAHPLPGRLVPKLMLRILLSAVECCEIRKDGKSIWPALCKV